MATVTPGKIFNANEVLTPANLNALGVPTVTIADSEVTTAKIANGAVTPDKFAAGAIPTAIPTGAVLPFAMNSAPSGWLAANGAAVSRTAYAALFTAIGTTYGTGDGSSTFNLPDLQGYFVRGAGTNSDGTAAGTFGTKQADAVISHTHSGTTGNDSPDHTHKETGAYTNNVGTGYEVKMTLGGVATNSTYSTLGASVRHQHTFTTSSQSPAGATETRPKNIALLYCIKA